VTGARSQRLRIAVAIAAAVIVCLPAGVASAATAGPSRATTADAAAKPSDWIVTLKDGVDVKGASKIAKDSGGRLRRAYKHALHGFAFRGSDAAVAALRRNPHVRTVVADGPVRVADTIAKGVSRIRGSHLSQPNAYDAGFRGNGVKVAVLDTGIDLTHPDLVPNLDLALGRNCITTGPPQDGHGHGTHVAGIIAAANNGVGYIGVAPEATLVPIKVLDDTGQGEWSNLICAIDYLTSLKTDADPTNDVLVANMSLGDTGSVGSCNDGFVREAICRSVAAGITYVAAAGNSTADVSGFIPAAYPEVIAVSALTDLDGEPGGVAGCPYILFFCDDTLAEYTN
jgi:subtilisin family serine protease